VAILRYVVTNPASQDGRGLHRVLARQSGRRGGPRRAAAGIAQKRTSEYRESGNLAGLLMTNPGAAHDAPLAGSFALVRCRSRRRQGDTLCAAGRARSGGQARCCSGTISPVYGQLGPEAAERNNVGSVCLDRSIAPGAKAEFTFLLAWHFPNRTTAFGWRKLNGDTSGVDPNAIIGNYYCQRFPDAWAAAEYARQNLPTLEPRMKRFLAAMRESTLPAPVKEAAMAKSLHAGNAYLASARRTGSFAG